MVAGGKGDREDAAADGPRAIQVAGERTVNVLVGGLPDGLPLVAHGAWMARHIPGARARLRRGEGHLSIGTGGLGPVFDDLIDLAGL
jgi:hypothetical protein